MTIIPESRLLFWVSVVVVPFAAVAALLPDAAALAGLLIAAVVAVALLDAVLAQGSLDEIGVDLPEVVRLAKDREGVIEVRFKNGKQRKKRLRLGLPLPHQIHSDCEDLWTMLPAASVLSRLEWRCTPIERGSYSLKSVCLEAASPWGFWAVRAKRPAQTEIRVYPNLLAERKGVAALFLNRGNLGAHAQRQVGKGRDFEKLRDYVHGDSFDDVHWKATAKRGRPVTKVFQIERTQEVYVIVDASRLSGRIQHPTTKFPGAGTDLSVVSGRWSVAEGSGRSRPTTDHGRLTTDRSSSETTVLERFITAALMLGLAAEQQGDLFGLLTFSDRVEKFVRARNGKSHYATCRDAIYALQPQSVTPDFDELCSFIRLRLRRRALLVFLTSLDDPVLAEGFVRNMDLICRQHLILVNMLQPPGVRPLFSDPNVSSLDEVFQQLGGHMRWQKLGELERVLRRRGVQFSLIENEKLTAQLVAQYLGVKRRQLI